MHSLWFKFRKHCKSNVIACTYLNFKNKKTGFQCFHTKINRQDFSNYIFDRLIAPSFCSLSYSGVCYNWLKLFVNDVITALLASLSLLASNKGSYSKGDFTYCLLP